MCKKTGSCDHHKELPWWVICLLWPLLVTSTVLKSHQKLLVLYSRNRSHAVGALSTWKNTLLIQEFLGYTSQVHCTCHQPEWETSFWCLVTQTVRLKNKTSILENPIEGIYERVSQMFFFIRTGKQYKLVTFLAVIKIPGGSLCAPTVPSCSHISTQTHLNIHNKEANKEM